MPNAPQVATVCAQLPFIMKKRVCFAFLFWIVASPFLAAESPTPTPTPPPALILIKAAHWVDPVAGVVRENQAILIEGDKVK